MKHLGFDDFDDLDLDDSGFDTDDDFDDGFGTELSSGISGVTAESSEDSGFVSDDEADRKNTVVQCIKLIGCGIGVLIIILIIVAVANRIKSRGQMAQQTEQSVQQVEQAQTPVNETQASDTVQSTPEQSQTVQGSEDTGWIEFSGASEEIYFSETPIETTFTVTKVRNYVKVTSVNNDIMLKTVATGSLSGYNGTYEVELPYNKGSLLQPGAVLKVSIQVGEYGGSSVVGEIVVI